MATTTTAAAAAAAAAEQPKRIGVFICTVRQPRCNPQIAEFVTQTIQSLHPSSSSKDHYSLHTIDLAEWNLPFVDEPAIPAQIHDPSTYTHAHTRKWSAEISSHDGFIFVTPQYNWGYPGVLKNAVDFLYNEWKNKPALVVSYGGRGGGRANAQLTDVLLGLGMRVTAKSVELKFPSRDFLQLAAAGKPLGLDGPAKGSSEKGGQSQGQGQGQGQVWADERFQIAEAFDELLAMLSRS